MGEIPALTADGSAIVHFARRLHRDLGFEKVLLYGAFKREFVAKDYEYRLICVSSTFQQVDEFERQYGLHDVYFDVGGNGALRLICLTPEEFESAKKRITLVAEVLPEAIDLLAEVPTAP
ncbi:MAG: hypothetical protein U0893_19490 [Chloroflexota bacterium]